MSWHTSKGQSTCLLNNLNGIYRRMDAAIFERVEALGYPYTHLYDTILPKLLSPTERSLNDVPTLCAEYFLYPKTALEMLDSKLPYTVKLPTIYAMLDEYKKDCKYMSYNAPDTLERGQRVKFPAPFLTPKPSAKVLDSWYRFINNMYIVSGDAIRTGYVRFETVWDTTRVGLELHRHRLPDGSGGYATGDITNGNTCYFLAIDAVTKNRIGIVGSYTPDPTSSEDQWQKIKEFGDALIMTLVDSNWHTYQQTRDYHDDRGFWHETYGNDNNPGEPRYDKAYSTLVDIAIVYGEEQSPFDGPPLSAVADLYVRLNDVYGAFHDFTFGNSAYHITYQDSIPALRTDGIRGFDEDGSSFEVFTPPVKLDLKYYDPPEET